MSTRKYFSFNITVNKNLTEKISCRSHYYEKYIQTSALGNPGDYIIKLTTFYQREYECRVFCCDLTAYIHTVQLYRFHPLFTEIV